MVYYFVTWAETRREAVNRFGRLGYVSYSCAGVLALEEGKKSGIVYFSPTKARPALLRFSTVSTFRKLDAKPRKNSRIWKECDEGSDPATLCQFARASEARRHK